jgi:hypothetical protein
MRYCLGLLPLIRPWCPTVPRYPSPGLLNVCAGGHDTTELLLPDGGHCISCPSCFAKRHHAHERINKVYAAFAREAGATVTYNPSTDLMMAGQFGDACSRILFSKRTNPSRTETADELMAALKASASPSSDPAIRAAAQAKVNAIIASCPKKHEGLRVDCIIQLRNYLLWLDIGVVHSTAASKITLVAAFLKRLHAAELSAGGNLASHPMAQTPSPCVSAYTKIKVIKYTPAVKEATLQVARGNRASAPVLSPCIFSHAGEMSPESLRVIELISRDYKHMMSLLYFEDGVTLKRRTAAFRTRFKDALMVANANGFGATLAHAGTPRAGKTLSPAEAYGGLPHWEVVY